MDEPLVEEVAITTRPFDEDVDTAMVFSTWRNSCYYSAAIPPKKENDIYFKDLTRRIASILKRATVRIACLEDCPSVIVGYVVYTGPHLNWIYVKGDYRNKGIGSMLYPKEILTVTPDLTKIGLEIVQKKKLVIKGDREDG